MFFLPITDLIYGVDRYLLKQRLTDLLQETKMRKFPKYFAGEVETGGGGTKQMTAGALVSSRVRRLPEGIPCQYRAALLSYQPSN